MKIRTMSRQDWVRITRRVYRAEDIVWQGNRGRISLLQMEEVTEPLAVECPEGKKVIADKGYSWLQIALHGAYFWFTAMFDEQDDFCEIYVDMTDGNVADVEDAWFRDMYLDFVVTHAGVMILDRDELDAALAAGDISAEQYSRTLTEGEKIHGWLISDKMQIIDFVTAQYRRMKYGETE